MSTETYEDKHEWGSLNGRFATIASADDGGGYEWDEFHVLRGTDGYLYVGADSGCSCNSFGDGGDDFTRVGSWQEAADLVKAWMVESDWREDARTESGMSLIERLTQIRPEPRIEIDARDPWAKP